MTKPNMLQRCLLLITLTCFYSICVMASGLEGNGLNSANESTVTSETKKPFNVVFPTRDGSNRKNTYVERLVEAALAAQEMTVNFEYFVFPTNQTRLNQLLVEGETLDAAWLPANDERMSSLNAISIPLYQGLHGKRLLLINKNKARQFAEVTSVQDLTKFVGLQRHDWSEYEILVKNGLQINGDLEPQGMLRALNQGVGDYFPRSALTIIRELQRSNDDALQIDENLLITYPVYYLLFLSPKQPELAEALKKGFFTIYSNGEFQNIFNQFFETRLAPLNLTKRTVLTLENPILSKEYSSKVENYLF